MELVRISLTERPWGLCSLQSWHNSADTERKSQSPFLVGVGIPREREPVTSSFAVGCFSSPLRTGSY